MGSSSSYHDSHVLELVGKILILSILVLSVIIISVFFFHLYAKWFWYPRLLRPHQQDSRRHRRGDGHQSGVTVLRRGLNPSFLKTIPVISFDPKDFKEGLECTVCLSEVCQGEETRILPKCCHGFHVQCIDMWFHSHSTCPICRDSVSDETAISVENLLETQHSPSSTDTGVGGTPTYFPSNMLFWGDETQVITLTSQLEDANNSPSSSHAYNTPPRPDLLIHIPTQSDDDDDDVQDQKSPVTSSSSSSRMRSLTRILSSGSRRLINPFGTSATPTVEQRTRTHL